MSVIITSRVFTDEFTGAGGGGVSYPNGGVLGKMIVEIDFYSYLAYTSKNLQFISATKTITNLGYTGSGDSFLDDGNIFGAGIKPGMSITVVNTGFNDGFYTVASVTANVITTVQALVNETAASADIYDDTPINALDFYYNLIENTAQETYLSLTDRGSIQRFTVDGIDATDLITETNMLVASSSFGWVTNVISNLLTGETSEVKIIGMGVTAHQQAFKITQQFSIAPFWLREQLINFENSVPPPYFEDGKALKYINRIDAKFTFTDPDIPHTGSLTNVNGLTNWFNQNDIRSLPEYYIESTTYGTLDRIDFKKVTNVTITIKSRNGKFVNPTTQFILDFLYLPLSESDYIGTDTKTLRQNLMNDRQVVTPAAVEDGEYFGTDYQVLKNITAGIIDANTAQIVFQVDFSTYLKGLLELKSDDNRNYALSVTTQDVAITTTIQTDRVPVLADVDNMDWDKTNPALYQSVDTLRAYHFPEIDNNPTSDVAGWEGDPIYLKLPFRIESAAIGGITPTIMRVGFQIVAFKTGEEDFVIEEKIFDTSLVRKLNGIQTIDFSETRPFRDTEPDYETVSIIRDSSLDVGTMVGFLMSYGLILRYEFWLKIIQDAERFQYPIFNDIPNITESWHTMAAAGWSLKVKFIIDVKGYDDFVTPFWQYFNMRALEVGTPPDVMPIFTSTTKYYTEDGLNEVNGIIIGGKTKIVFTATGDFSVMPPDFDTFYGYFFADLENTGSYTNRRFASTEFDSEEDSPFSATPVDVLADSSHASDNVTINVYNFDTVVVETIYDDSIEMWSTRGVALLIYPEIGCKSVDLRQWEDGSLHHWDDGEQASFES